MSVRTRRRDSSTVASQLASALAGAVAGVAAGVVLAQLLGGASGIGARLRRGPAPVAPEPAYDGDWEEADDDLFDEPADDEEAGPPDDLLGRRVLEAFVNDPILAERAIDIEVRPQASVALSGSVDAESEIAYAETLARGVPGVARVESDLLVAP